MMWFVLAGFALFLWLYITRSRIQIPGPRGAPICGAWRQMQHAHKMHMSVMEWQKKYGPVIYIPLMGSSGVVVSSQEAIYEFTVKKGREFGGRSDSFRLNALRENTGILARNMDDTWRFLRKTSQRHLKQFGSGMSKLESLIEQMGEDMFIYFEKNNNIAFDPHQIIFDTALKNIIFLITGERTKCGDSLMEKLRHYEDRFLRTNARFPVMSTLLVDFFPFSRYLGLKAWDIMKKFITFERDIWSEIKRRNVAGNSESDSLCKILLSHAAEHPGDDRTITEKDARRTSMNLLLAGVTTTSNTFYAAVNVLAHHPDIQKRLVSEILKVCPAGKPVTLACRPSMPYCRAFLWELLRYTSVVPLSVAHRTVSDQTIQGYVIPKDTQIQANIYALHHDPEFWKDPELIKPERFLDDAGELVPVDHPNRKHVMPFGAGPRVCLGETLAMTRLFLWTTTLVSRFHILPAKGNDPSTLDTTQFYFVGVLRPTRYEVVLSNRF